MQLIYGEEIDLEKVTLEEIHKLEQRTGIRFVFRGSEPVAITVPTNNPGTVQIVRL